MLGHDVPANQYMERQTAFGIRYYVFLPERTGPDTRLIVSVHGISRNALMHGEAWSREALRRGFAVAAPLFDRENHPRFQRICQPGKPGWADLALEAMLDEIERETGVRTARFHLTGYSGGAQFAHRYAICRPERILSLGLAAAGWYTFPDVRAPYPRGLAGFSVPGLRPKVRLALRIPVLVAVGEHDDQRDEALKMTTAIDEMQGLNRIERGRNWIARWQKRALAHGLEPSSHFALLPRTGHSFEEAADPARGDLVRRYLDFVESTTRRSPAENGSTINQSLHAKGKSNV